MPSHKLIAILIFGREVARNVRFYARAQRIRSVGPNAGPQPRLEAGARYERRLAGVGCRPWLGALAWGRSATTPPPCPLSGRAPALTLVLSRLHAPRNHCAKVST